MSTIASTVPNVSTATEPDKVQTLMDLMRKRPMTSTVLQEALHTLPQTTSASGWVGVVRQSTQCEAHNAVSQWISEVRDNMGYGSCMGGGKAHFHPGADFFYLKTAQEQVSWLKKKVQFTGTLPESVTSPSDWKEVHSCLNAVLDLVGATGVSHYIKTSNKNEEKRVAAAAVTKATKAMKKARWEINEARKKGDYSRCSRNVADPKPPKPRNTCRGELILSHPSVNATQNSTCFKNLYHGDYTRALKFCSEFAGRVYEWSDSWVTAHSLRLAKVGLLDVALDVYSDELKTLPVTASFLALAVAEFGARKEFTLESQKQGALNPHLETLLRVVKYREPSGLKLIAYILPTEEIFNEVFSTTPEVILDIHSRWTVLMGVFGRFLQQEWKKGVGKSSRRLMRVLPKGSHVNSTGWNSVADAWQNGCRFLRISASVGGIESQPLYLKVLQLIANDQFQWGGAVSKKMDPNVGVFHDITANGFLPWDAVLHPERFDNARVVTTLAESCNKHKCSMKGWLGLPKLRTEEVREHTDMICGCKVPPMSVECAEFLTTLGIFGSNEWSGK